MKCRERIVSSMLAALAGLALTCVAAAAQSTPAVLVGSVSGAPGEAVTLTVTFRAGGGNVSGVQNDVSFDAATPIVACSINRDLNKGLGATRISADQMRALIFGFDSAVLLPDGAVLYTCTIHIAADAAPGVYPLKPSSVYGSDQAGNPVAVDAEAGAVVVTDAPPVATPTLVPAPVPTEPSSGGDEPAILRVGGASGAPGQTVTVTVTLSGDNVYSIQNDIRFPQDEATGDILVAAAARADGRPDCVGSSQVGISDAIFVYQPSGCTVGVDCIGLRAELAATGTFARDQSPLYSCAMEIRGDLPAGSYPLGIDLVFAGDTQGTMLRAGGEPGFVEVQPAPEGGVAALGQGAAGPAAADSGGCAIQPVAPMHPAAWALTVFPIVLFLLRMSGRRRGVSGPAGGQPFAAGT
jgi:hypothetical protein